MSLLLLPWFSCHGIEFKKSTNLLKLSKEYNQVLNERYRSPEIDLELLKNTWDNIVIWKDRERIMLDEIKIAYDIYFQEYLEYIEKSKIK